MRAAASLIIGLFFGAVGAMLQAYVLLVGGKHVPVGAVLMVLTLVLVARACAWWARSRWGAALFSIGWLIASLVMASTTSAGDLVITNGSRQLAYLAVGAMLLAAASGFPLLPEDDTPAAPRADAEAGAGAVVGDA